MTTLQLNGLPSNCASFGWAVICRMGCAAGVMGTSQRPRGRTKQASAHTRPLRHESAPDPPRAKRMRRIQAVHRNGSSSGWKIQPTQVKYAWFEFVVITSVYCRCLPFTGRSARRRRPPLLHRRCGSLRTRVGASGLRPLPPKVHGSAEATKGTMRRCLRSAESLYTAIERGHLHE